MLRDFDISDASWSWFFLANLAATLLALLVLLWVYVYRRHQWIKPSTLLLFYTHILFQWPLTIFSSYVEHWLPEPWVAVGLIHGFVLPGLLWSSIAFELSATALWSRLSAPLPTARRSDVLGRDAKLLSWSAVVLAAIYLAFVPATSTGLYVLLTDPAAASSAREQSLKLVENPVPRYALSILAGTIAPLFTALVVSRWRGLKATDLANTAAAAAALVLVWALASLTGAKATPVFMLLVAFAALAWSRRLEVPLEQLLPAILLALLPAVAVAIAFALSDPQQADADLLQLGGTQFLEVAWRAIVGPFQVAIWYLHYAQTEGPLGVGAFERLAPLFGAEAIDAPNLIGLVYGPIYYGHGVESTISATAGFPFANYLALGLPAIGLNLVLLAGLDVVLLLSAGIADRLLVPFLAAETICVLKFTQSEYLTVWVTHGFVLIALTCVALSLRRSLGSPRASAFQDG